MTIKPIETVYNGYRFRSRLEARWAVFFDTLGIKYEYEPEGFDLGEAGWYLPDFWLPLQKYWIEIKGKRSEGMFAKSAAFAQQGAGQVIVFSGEILPGLVRETVRLPDGDGVKEFDSLYATEGAAMLAPLGYYNDLDPGYRPYDSYDPWSVVWVECRECNYLYTCAYPGRADCPYCHAEDQGDPASRRLLNAYLVARQARFEHGETPR